MTEPKSFARGGFIPGPTRITPGYIHPGAIPSSYDCRHDDAVPVDLASGEAVAYLCPTCDEQLPASFGEALAHRERIRARQGACEHTTASDITSGFGEVLASRCDDCGKPLPRT